MKLIRGTQHIRPEHQTCVATIGNFDGVHLGHQSVLEQLIAQAKAMRLPATVITFEPQPQEYFQKQQAPARITRFREKYTALSQHQIDYLFLLKFNQSLAALSPSEFIQQVLVDGLDVKYLVVGDDFKFGKNRAGDFQTLLAAGQAHGFEVVNTHSFRVDDNRVSSTRIRQALAAGDFAGAQ